MKLSLIAIAAVVLSAGAAHAWSPQNCMLKCRLVAAPDRVQICQTRNGSCERFAGGNHESDATVRASAAQWTLPEPESIPIALTLNELLTNAVKHSAAAPDAEVVCTLSWDDARVEVSIANPARLPSNAASVPWPRQ